MQTNDFILGADAIKALGYQIVDCIADEFNTPTDRPIFPPKQSAADMETAFGGPLPEGGMDPQALLAQMLQRLLPNAGNPNHPGVMAYVMTGSLPLPALTEMLVAAIKLRPTTWINQPASCHIETGRRPWRQGSDRDGIRREPRAAPRSVRNHPTSGNDAHRLSLPGCRCRSPSTRFVHRR